MKIKICGVTIPEDVLFLNRLPVDFIGFIFVPASPRRLDLMTAGVVAPLVREGIKKVGVFIDEHPARVLQIARSLHLDLLQFHGNESPEYCSRFELPYFKTIRVKGEIDRAALRGFRPEAFLLDTFVPRVLGGTGKAFDWSIARKLREEGCRILLAGGLTPKNVGRAVREVGPWGVDVSSGVESSPGVKDYGKLREFFRAVRERSRKGHG